MRRRILQLSASLAVFSAVAVLVGSPASAQSPTANAGLNERTIITDVSSVPAGESEWVATNTGVIEHELLFLLTDLPAGDLPVGSDDKVNRFAEGIEDVGIIRSDELVPGATVTEAFTLAAGNYALICNIPGHYAAGMWASFTVTSDEPADEPVDEPADDSVSGPAGDPQLPSTGATGLSGSDGEGTGLPLAIGLAALGAIALAAGTGVAFRSRRSRA